MSNHGYIVHRRASGEPVFFVGEPRPREGPKAESGDGVLGEGQQPPPTS